MFESALARLPWGRRGQLTAWHRRALAMMMVVLVMVVVGVVVMAAQHMAGLLWLHEPVRDPPPRGGAGFSGWGPGGLAVAILLTVALTWNNDVNASQRQ